MSRLEISITADGQVAIVDQDGPDPDEDFSRKPFARITVENSSPILDLIMVALHDDPDEIIQGLLQQVFLAGVSYGKNNS